MTIEDRSRVRANQLNTDSTLDATLISAWRWFYRKKGWHKITKFDSKGRVTAPYALYKAKNVTDAAVRARKLHKARPITPYAKHPMAKLLSLVGRAWSFALRHLKGEHFIQHDCQSVPRMLKEAAEALRGKGELSYEINDVDSCYPSMPKEAMQVAMRDILRNVRQNLPPGAGEDPKILVPKRGKKKCSWAQQGEVWGHASITFSTMLEVIDFDLDNCYVITYDGRLLKQARGIPMGSALSPPLAIGTLAWMEHEWMQTLDDDAKARFRMKRYMDDVITVTAKDDSAWDVDRFREDFRRSECYWAPLKLEAADNAHFLETALELDANGGFRMRLKNVNEGCEREPRVWRYHRWDSFTCAKMKEGIVVGCLLKVSAMASDDEGFALSVTSKLREFTALGYPAHVLNGVIGRAYARTKDERLLRARL